MAQQTHDGSTAIFSPSVARIAASTARDWSYVDSWLATKFPRSRSVPNFERNPATLKALLAMASLNEVADETSNMMARADRAALGDVSRSVEPFADLADGTSFFERASATIRDELLAATSGYLNEEGKSALDAMADTAVQYGNSFPDLEDLSGNTVTLQIALFESSQAILRVDVLNNYLLQEAEKTSNCQAAMQSDNYKLPPELAKQNMELQRKTKAMIVQLSDIRERLTAVASSQQSSPPTIQLVAQEEEQFLTILSHKKELDVQMSTFESLPNDAGKARDEVEALRQKLRGFTSRRDEVFEGLVEQASPVRRR